MKNLLFIFSLFLSFSAFSQTDLRVFSTEGAFTLYVNGNKINENPVSKIEVKELTGDDCQIKLVFEDSALGEVKTDVFFDNAVKLVYQAAKKKNGKLALRLSNDNEYLSVKDDAAADVGHR